MAKKLRNEKMLVGGIEGRLTTLGDIFFILGIIGGFVAFFVAVRAAQRGHSFLWIMAAIESVFIGYVLMVLFKACGEAIRLLKKIANLPYGGQISEPNIVPLTLCSNCHTRVHELVEACPNCGENFDDDASDGELPEQGDTE